MSSDKGIRAVDARRRRGPTATDIIDRVLDRGVLIDYHSRVALAGIDTLVTVAGQYVVTSSETSLAHAALVASPARAVNARPRFDGPADPFVYAPVAPKRRPRRAPPARNQKKR